MSDSRGIIPFQISVFAQGAAVCAIQGFVFVGAKAPPPAFPYAVKLIVLVRSKATTRFFGSRREGKAFNLSEQLNSKILRAGLFALQGQRIAGVIIAVRHEATLGNVFLKLIRDVALQSKVPAEVVIHNHPKRVHR